MTSVFQNDQRSGYEEVASYSPSYYREVLEMEAIYQICGTMLEGMASGLELAVSNHFVETMEAETIGRMERFLFIPQVKSRPLENRRRVVLSVLLGSGKISASRLKEMILPFTDALVDISFPESKLLISIDMDEGGSGYMRDIVRMLGARLPAHLAYILAGVIGNEARQDIRIDSRLHIVSHCYPQHNLEPLLMDNSWKMDGSYMLSRYKVGSYVDVYPVDMLFGMGIQSGIHTAVIQTAQYSATKPVVYDAEYHNISSVYPQCRGDPCYPAIFMLKQDIGVKCLVDPVSTMCSATGISAGASMAANVSGDASAKASVGTELSIKHGIEAELSTKEDLIVEYHLWRMDGNYRLDKSRRLDSDVYTVTL